jgi:hypothetical protein
VVIVEHTSVYVQTASRRSPYRAEHATPELVYDLVFGCSQRLSLHEILERMSGQSHFGRACFIKGLAVTSVIGAKALGEFLVVARDEFDYLTSQGTWADPSMRDAFLLALNRNFASYGALIRGVRSEQNFDGIEAFTSDMDYRLMTVAVEAKQSQRPAAPGDPDDAKDDRSAELQREHEGFRFWVDGSGLPKIYGLEVKVDGKVQNVSWGLAAGINARRLKKVRRGLRSFDGISRSVYETAIDKLGEFKLKAYASALEAKGIHGGTKTWLLTNYDNKVKA